MQDFIFYIELGLNHVLDFSAYDHILFLAALALPFGFDKWKKVVLLATVFTITHCISLFLSVYKIAIIDVSLIEFLIPVTIFATAVFNLIYVKSEPQHKSILLHIIATAFFGLVHGFGFSNYFNMLMAEQEEKIMPLLGFATGIEVSQVIIVLTVLGLTYLLTTLLKIKSSLVIVMGSILILIITIPMLMETYPD